MTTFYRFPSNQNLPAEFVRDGVSVSVIGDYFDGEEYVGYLVNASAPIAEWAEHLVDPAPASPMRIFG